MPEANEDIEPVSTDQKSDHTMEQTIILGKLARGIAHDINNLVTSIQGNAQLAERAKDNPKELTKSLSNIRLASRLITELTGQIQAFSRTHQMPTSCFDLKVVVDEIVLLIGSTLAPGITLQTEITNEPVYVVGASSQLAQAVMNLCTNALQALGQEESGELTIKLIAQNGKACIQVADNGHGIDQDMLGRIFDPFYTTKHFGMGSGLGLAVVKSVIDAHKGVIKVESTIKQGAKFDIRLPLAPADAVEKFTAAPTKEYTPSQRTSNAYKILLVDDEPTIRSLGVDVLHSLGYRVTVASDGREAFEIFERKPEYFDIILSDSRMPEMTGLELAAAVRKHREDIPFILITAFDDTRENPLFDQLSITDIIPKPFRIEQLQRSLRQAMLGKEA
ncbi:hybrid sensor histidine kinase/response regulator [Cerasicoccus fimbriatus]|uniref:hybrid sensor histidine kinase/response regulator n=1 Tax=Cerasicoccus fimbriatus TaxID=3014554 RepID=UPI0022B3FE4B|nr:ATP-binding protein [Cerasicoccus sp. TK19100]